MGEKNSFSTLRNYAFSACFIFVLQGVITLEFGRDGIGCAKLGYQRDHSTLHSGI